jgi:peroxiredoxin
VTGQRDPGIAGGPKVGDPAPDFELPDAQLSPVRLADFRGKAPVLLVFYPFIFTRVCSGELAALRDAHGTFDEQRVQLLAVSCDPPAALREFADQRGIGYPLLSDFWPHGAVARAYGVFDEATGAAHRGSFLIDRDGVVRWTVVNAIADPRDLEDYRRAIASLTDA